MGDTYFDSEVVAGDDWSWPMRRRAQEILPWLYLGPAEASRDLPQLHSLGITAMLTVASAAEAAYILKPRYPQAFAYSVLPVEDRREQNLIVLVPQVRAFIDQVREQTNGKVLVHDDGGISRAPAIVILYLMDEFNLSFVQAATHVQNRRYCVHLSAALATHCGEYEAICAARKACLDKGGAQPMQLEMAVGERMMRRKRGGGGPDDSQQSCDYNDEEERRKQVARLDGAQAALPVPLPP